jgi:translation initiation factor IF-2
MELIMAFGARGEEMRHVFWISPKQNPEVVLRQNLQNQGTQPGGVPTTPGQPGGGTRPPAINVGQPGGGGTRPPTINVGQPGGGGGGRPGGPGSRR